MEFVEEVNKVEGGYYGGGKDKPKKPIYKKPWFWITVLVVLLIFYIIIVYVVYNGEWDFTEWGSDGGSGGKGDSGGGDDGEPEEETIDFDFVQGKDSSRYDITRLKDKSIEEMKDWCRENPDCMGFNTNGWMKKYVQPEDEMLKFAPNDPEKGFYVKRISPKPKKYATIDDVQLVEQVSDATCVPGRKQADAVKSRDDKSVGLYGLSDFGRRVWTNHGCRGKFAIDGTKHTEDTPLLMESQDFKMQSYPIDFE